MGKIIQFFVKKKKVNAVYGYSHTTINYWHLNYFHSLIENKNYYKKIIYPKKYYVIRKIVEISY